jgi:hypothetical protein
MAFDLLMAGGEDPRPLPLRKRKTRPARIGKGAESWIALTDGIVGDGRALYRAVVDAALEGIVAKRLADAYRPSRTRWHKVLNRGYSQRHGRCRLVSRAGVAPRRPTMTSMGSRLKRDFGRGRPILPPILVEAIRRRGGT